MNQASAQRGYGPRPGCGYGNGYGNSYSYRGYSSYRAPYSAYGSGLSVSRTRAYGLQPSYLYPSALGPRVGVGVGYGAYRPVAPVAPIGYGHPGFSPVYRSPGVQLRIGF
ncbi:MAG: hypothetical protein AB8B50_01170 [Pirellulaceae bacterium]